MSDTQTTRRLEKKDLRLALLLLGIFASCAVFAWWTAQRTDRQMRQGLLQRVRLVANALHIERVKLLSGTEADRVSPVYQRLKEQLTATCSTDPQCRFLYLVGRRADSTVFFFVDSEPIGSRAYSPPGQIFDEVSEEFRRALDTKTAIVEGPVSDRRGLRVRAFVPLIDPQTGAVLAVVGMDVDARAWKWDLAARAILPVGLFLVSIVILTGAFVVTRRADASPKPLQRRLLPPLAAMVIILMAGAGGLLWQMQKQRLAEGIANNLAAASYDLRTAMDQQALVLDAALKSMAADAGVQNALSKRDVDGLLAVCLPVFDALKKENMVTHLYFLDPTRLCLLRVHNPAQRGDRIEHFTVLEAERIGRTVSGMELGQWGNLALRVVRPVFSDGKLVGYIELGKEVTHILQMLPKRSGVELALVIRKEHLTRQKWEDGMRRFGLDGDWDRFPQSVVVYASQGRLPEAFGPLVDPFPASGHSRGATDLEVVSDGRGWQAAAWPLQDASGKEIGCFLVMHDISAEKESFAHMMSLAGITGGVVLAAVLSFVYVLVSRTDRGIRAQQAELAESQARWQFALEGAGDGVWDWNVQTNEVFFSRQWKAMLGFEEHEIGNSIADWETRLHPDDRRHVHAELDDHFTGRKPVYISEYRLRCKDGDYMWVLDRGKVIQWTEDGKPLRAIGTHTDITERVRAAEEHLRLADQFQQAQRMESVGRLAGGVAHDFNNMLGVILGYVEIAQDEASRGTALHDNLTQIRKAAQRSADLTRQLLAFARKQTIDPRALDLNRTVERMLKMLRRLIGEDIDLDWLPEADLWPVKMDPAQIDQIMANLCVNARDAIAGVGKVTIETQNVILDEAYCAGHAGFAPGEFVMLAVSDNGCGMDEETRRRLFEPFFTTKETGKGTGLGLSTVYGIVKQNDGFVNIYSEPGQGTTFKIYIPRHAAGIVETRDERAVEFPQGQDETVLLVEDEATMLKMVKGMLEKLGYTVLSAGTPAEAIHLAWEHAGEFDLLLSDVIMPEMNGRELAERLLAGEPEMKCLFMSGYTANVIAHHGVLDEGVQFIQKPFSIKDLAVKVRKTLDG